MKNEFSKPKFIVEASSYIPKGDWAETRIMRTYNPETEVEIMFRAYPYQPYYGRYKQISAYGAYHHKDPWRLNLSICCPQGESKFITQVQSPSKSQVFKVAHLMMDIYSRLIDLFMLDNKPKIDHILKTDWEYDQEQIQEIKSLLLPIMDDKWREWYKSLDKEDK